MRRNIGTRKTTKVLVTGSSGLLGSHLMAALSRSYEVVGVDRHPWWGDTALPALVEDLTQPGVISRVIESIKPDILIHCAAWADVDACEQNPEQANVINAELTRSVVDAVSPSCLAVYISTDGVFQGHTPYVTEDEPPSPRTVYGRSKLRGELEVQQRSEYYLIVRTNFYGWSSGRKKTAGEWLMRALETGERITLFDDFVFSPIYVVDFATRLIRLIDVNCRGIVHLAGRERVSKYQFGALMAQAAGLPMSHVRRGSIDDAALVAPRPKDMSLASRRFVRLTGMNLPGCLEGLQRFMEDRTRPLSVRVSTHQQSSSIAL